MAGPDSRARPLASTLSHSRNSTAPGKAGRSCTTSSLASRGAGGGGEGGPLRKRHTRTDSSKPSPACSLESCPGLPRSDRNEAPPAWARIGGTARCTVPHYVSVTIRKTTLLIPKRLEPSPGGRSRPPNKHLQPPLQTPVHHRPNPSLDAQPNPPQSGATSRMSEILMLFFRRTSGPTSPLSRLRRSDLDGNLVRSSHSPQKPPIVVQRFIRNRRSLPATKSATLSTPLLKTYLLSARLTHFKWPQR